MDKKILVIDAGHGGSDPGACNGQNTEASRMLTLCKRLKDKIDKSKYIVYLTRTGDTFVSLYERALFANKIKADLFISNHMNSASVQASGVEVWKDYGTQQSNEIADIMCNELAKIFPINRGVKMCAPNYRFTVLSQTSMPAILNELGFINNNTDLILFDNNVEQICDAIITATDKFFNIKSDVPVGGAATTPDYSYGGDLDMNVLNFCKKNPVNSANPNSPATGILQTLLTALGYNPRGIDGHFGPGCRQAVVAFQKAHGLAADGSCGPATFEALFKSF